MNMLNRKTLLETTISSIRDHIRRLEAQLRETEQELQQKRAVLNVWVSEFENLDKEQKTRISQRIGRGEARRVVSRLYDENETARLNGLTVKEIADATKLKWTTVRNVVHNVKNGFIETDGRWKRTADSQPRLKVA